MTLSGLQGDMTKSKWMILSLFGLWATRNITFFLELECGKIEEHGLFFFFSGVSISQVIAPCFPLRKDLWVPRGRYFLLQFSWTAVVHQSKGKRSLSWVVIKEGTTEEADFHPFKKQRMGLGAGPGTQHSGTGFSTWCCKVFEGKLVPALRSSFQPRITGP